MSLLSRVEGLLEGMFEGGTRRLFRPRLQPIEIMHALDRVMAAEKVVSGSSVDVPNLYEARLGTVDFRRLESLKSTIERDAAAYLERRAREQDFHPISAIRVNLIADPAVPASFVRGSGAFDSQARTVAVPAIEQTRRLDPVPAIPQNSASGDQILLLIAEDGREVRIDQRPVKLGRGLDNDFVFRDARVSRYHAEIKPTQSGWVVRDLGSTNGTFVNGERVEEIAIGAPTEISLGGCRLVPRTA